MLKKFTKKITVLAPEILPEIQKAQVKVIQDIFRPKYLAAAGLVYACTNDKKINSQVRQAAKARGLLVNLVDTPQQCDFITPAIFKRQEMVVAVSSGGRNLAKTIRWRNKIKKLLKND